MAERRRVIEPSQLRKRRRRRRNLKLILWLILILGIVGGIAFLSHISAFRIQAVNFNGNSLISTDSLQATVERDLAGNYYGLFPKSNILLYPKNKIRTDILNGYQTISDVSIKLKGLQNLDINITERKPTALWCLEKSEASSSSCYFMDQTGYVFYNAPIFTGETYFTYYGLISSSSPIGQRYLSLADFQKLQSFVKGIEDLGLAVDSISATDRDDLELHLDSGGRILFGLNQSVDQVVSNLQTAIDKNNPSANSINLNEIDYLDLHLDNQVIYKLKGSEGSTATSSTQ